MDIINEFSDPHHQMDILDCDQEPIHIPERVQGHGFLMACTLDTLKIVRVSDNTYTHTRIQPKSLLGQNIDVVLGKYALITLQEAIEKNDLAAFNPTRIPFPENKTYFDAIVHVVHEELVIEFEPHGAFIQVESLMSKMDHCFESLRACTQAEELLDVAATQIKDVSGFDRVMIYRFDEDWNGQVLVEKCSTDMESFLGLHFPATDIPAQARALFKRNQVRTITDILEPAALVIAQADNQQPLDMSDCVLRGVSPIHIEYLNNMGVRATMSMAIIYRQELWGLIACHHLTPKYINYELRNSLKIIAQLVSSDLGYMLLDNERKDKQALVEQEEQLYQKFIQRGFMLNETFNLSNDLLLLNPLASGAALLLHQQLLTAGRTPAKEQIFELLEWMNFEKNQEIYHTHQLPAVFEPAKHYQSQASGVLIVRFSPLDENYLIWFKQERVQEIHWGGAPQKTVVQTDDGYRLSPRKSFAKFTEVVAGKSERWSSHEIRSALRVRDHVKDILLKQHTEQLSELHDKLVKAYNDLEAFSYSVSHDLKAPLRSIDNYMGLLLEEYGDQLSEGGRGLAHTILDSTKNMNQLIEDLLKYAKIGRVNKIYNKFPLRPVLDEIIKEQLRKEEKERQIDIQITELPDIYGDRPLIKQVFANLISNALKYTRMREKAIIRIQGEPQEAQNRYSIQDNGIGLNMDYEKRIYQVFSRLHADNSEYEGTGIGLAIVHRILQSHQGQISVQSKLGEGSTFFVSFPKD